MAIYLDIAYVLEKEIRSQFSSGQFLPSEMDLADRFSVNRHTLRRAIDELVQAGLLLRQHGKGTMVLDNRIEYSLRSKGRFTESLEHIGLQASCEILNINEINADSKLATEMWVSRGTLLICLETLRCIDKVPVCLINHYFVSELLPGFCQQYRSGSVHHFIEQSYQISIARQQSLIGARLPERSEAIHLQCSKRLPLIVVRSNNVLKGSSRIIEYSVSRSRSDIFQMKVKPDDQG